jgi:hypothetical protein
VKLKRNETVSLVLLLIIPYILITGILVPFSSGIHGTTHSDGGNDYAFDGIIEGDHPSPINETSPGYPNDVYMYHTGHFTGDVYISDNTGWVICDGKVRYSGDLHIRNSELEYHIVDEREFGCLGPSKNYQKIELDGDRGEMEEGFSIYLLGLLGSAFGFILWISIYLSKRNQRRSRIIATISAFSGLVAGPSLFLLYYTNCGGFIALCTFICWLIFTVVGIILCVNLHRLSLKKHYLQDTNPYWFIVVGILLLVTCIMIFMYPDGISRDNYCRERSLGGIYMGLIGMFSSAGFIGVGAGRIYYQIRENNAPPVL